ncbi:hypothetical protein SNE40_013825 [Patella caerulea]|uniref:Gem-associated protein 2 n=1 Tax=Patella caerulea TaxID=87958 RepID=A0AAN8JGN4_PATCE
METEEMDESLLHTALKIDDTDDDNFDLDIPPTTGNEYLRRVRQEAKECPDVMVANLDTTVFHSKQTVKVSQPVICCPAPRGLAPSLSWQKHQIATFSTLRQRFIQHQAFLKKNKIKPTKVPNSNDAESWCRLCFGRLTVKPRQEAEPMIQNGDVQPKPSPPLQLNGSPPLVSIISAMAQPAIVKVLQYHVNWLEATGFTSHQGRWLYALMTALQKPLIPEACSLLRTLARLCSQIRATLSQDEAGENQLTELNLMICLVARYFDQGDLIEDGNT